MKRNSILLATCILLLLASSCQAGNVEPTPTPPASEPVMAIVSATGEVVPETWAALSLPMAGIVDEVHFREGETVEAGDVILQLSGREQLEAAVAAAGVELVAARQALDEIEETVDVVQAAAQSELANAREALRVARYTWEVQQEGNRANSDTIRTARARLVLAQAEVDDAKDEYDAAPGSASEDPAKAAALAAYMAAKKARDAAQRALNWYTGHPTEIQQAMLDADLAVAEARVAAAERAWAEVQDGVDPDTRAQAEARLANAEAQSRAAQAALADGQLRAPFGGTLAAIRIREKEWASPGQTLVVLADLNHLQVETTDLNEIDAARVVAGAKAVVTFDALPDVQAEATVARVAPKASEGSGVNYTVVLTLDRVPELLRWGMTAFVDIEAVDSFGG